MPDPTGSPFAWQNPRASSPDIEGYHTMTALPVLKGPLLDFDAVHRAFINLLRCTNYFPCLHAGLWGGYRPATFIDHLDGLYIAGAGTVTDNAVPRWNGTTGLLLQNSAVIIADTTNNISGLGSISLAAAPGATSPNIFAPGSSTYGIAVGATYVSLVTNGVARITVAADGKVTIPGLLDPTGLEMTPVGANPGGTAANTLWADSGAGNRFKVGTNTFAYLSEVPSISGLLTAANNLSDLASDDTALANLIGGATGVTLTELHNVGLHDGFGSNHGKASIGGILTMDPSALSFGGTPIVGQIPRWHKITIPYNQAGLYVAASTADATLFVLPSGGMIHAVVLKHSTAWDNGGGGARNSVSVGITGTLDKYAAAFRWDTGSAVSNTNFQLSTVQGIEAIGATTNIKMAWDASTTPANLNTGTVGSLDCYVLLSGLL